MQKQSHFLGMMCKSCGLIFSFVPVGTGDEKGIFRPLINLRIHRKRLGYLWTTFSFYNSMSHLPLGAALG